MFRKKHRPADAEIPQFQGVPGAEFAPSVLVRPIVTVRTLVWSGVLLLLAIGFVLILREIGSLVLLTLIAIVVAEGLRPMVSFVERARLPRALAIVIVYIGLLAVLVLLIALLVQPLVTEVTALTKDIPTYQHQIGNFLTDVQDRLHIHPNNDLTTQITNQLGTITSVVVAVSGYIFSFIVNFVVVLILGFLWLTTSDRLKAFTVDLFPPRQQPLAADVIREMGYRMGGYVQATAINMAVVGVMSGVAAAVLGLRSPILIGIFAGLTAAIPLVGPFIGAIPAVLFAFTVSPVYPLIVAVAFAVIQLADANLVLPQVMNRVVALPALAVVLALLIGGALAGIIGALLAIPLAAALQVIIVRVIVPAIHNAQGRTDEAFAKASTPLTPGLRAAEAGGRRKGSR